MKTSDENTTPFNRLLGTRCLFKKEGKSRYELSLGPDHLNRRGVAHGGVVASLLDTAMGAAVISSIAPEEWCGTLELSIQFREPVLPGTVAAEGRMVLPSFTTLSHCPEKAEVKVLLSSLKRRSDATLV